MNVANVKRVKSLERKMFAEGQKLPFEGKKLLKHLSFSFPTCPQYYSILKLRFLQNVKF